MFAVIKTGGKQYRVAAEDKITVMSLAGAPGDAVAFDQVLMLSNGGSAEVGAPFVAGASVAGQIVEQTRGPKVIAFKKRRRKNSKRKRGHRQDLTIVRITDILTGGARPAAQASAAAPESPAPAPPEGAASEPVVTTEASASGEQGPDERT
ncbi:MAG: 50S ribosomal protein L21 [Methylobacteriaceae bacterium]|nr:50S ribosomal protein L21 [Methylobacteriaceae bacterium]MBV9703130.1 50S ribosomal protein L21 [Methylobacteriaceae bacterium]